MTSVASDRPGGRSEPKVFICYRREDTAAHAGRLYDAMVSRFGERNVFMDVDLEPGVDFVKRITEVVSGCLVLIVVMGRNWATVEDEDGDVRIGDPTDFVRLEVETALSRPEVTPIPVLVSGARMPKREELPSELQAITRRNALELSDARWAYDVGRLNDRLDELLADVTGAGTPLATPPPPAPVPDLPAWRLLLEGMLVAGLTAYAANWLGQKLIPGPDAAIQYKEFGEAIASVIVRRAETWALVGAALAIWLGFRTARTDLFRLAMTGLLVGALVGAISGVIFAVPVYLYGHNHHKLLENMTSEVEAQKKHVQAELRLRRHWVEVGSLAVAGGYLGALIGALWRPRRLAAGLVSGIVAGVLFQLLVVIAAEETPGTAPTFGLVAATIAGLTLAALLALDRRQAAIKAPDYAAQ